MTLTCLLLAGGVCRAQGLSYFWSEWETTAVKKHGPELANGLLVYFHERSPDTRREPIATLFTEMAKIAYWDILRINRLPSFDEEGADDVILGLLSERIAEARRSGYKRIIVAGVSRGGWLALSAAALPDVDAVIGLAPGTSKLERKELERTRDLLAQRLAGAKAKRIAAFFFDGDPRDAVAERWAAAVRRALGGTRSTYMIVDRPPDLYGHAASGSGRLVRRYRDCLLQFIRGDNEPGGEAQCSPSSGYAVGSDIGFPVTVAPLRLPADASLAFAPYLGRWEGDDEFGAYLIVEAIDVEIERKVIVFRTGFSAGPAEEGPSIMMQAIPFQLEEANGGLFIKHGSNKLTRMRLLSATELEHATLLRTEKAHATSRRTVLRKQPPSRQ